MFEEMKKSENDDNDKILLDEERLLCELEQEIDSKINFYLKVIDYFTLFAIFFSFYFFACVSIYFVIDYEISSSLIIFSLILSIISINIAFNFILKIQNILDSLESDELNLGTLISYICLNFSTFSLIIFLVFLTMKIDWDFKISSTILLFTLYLIFLASITYFIFILPGLIKTGLYLEIFLIISYIFNFFISFSFILNLIENLTKNGIFSALLPICFSIILHSIYSLRKYFRNKEIDEFVQIQSLLVCIFSFITLNMLKSEFGVKIHSFLIIFISFAFFSTFSIMKISEIRRRTQLME